MSRSLKTIPALTICQPWAWAIVHGPKRIENRTWRTHYRGPLLIHAGSSRKWLRQGKAFLERQGIELPEDLPMGVIVGTCNLVDVVPLREVHNDPFAGGPLCWILEDCRAFETPVPYLGRLGLFPVKQSLVREAA